MPLIPIVCSECALGKRTRARRHHEIQLSRSSFCPRIPLEKFFKDEKKIIIIGSDRRESLLNDDYRWRWNEISVDVSINYLLNY